MNFRQIKLKIQKIMQAQNPIKILFIFGISFSWFITFGCNFFFYTRIFEKDCGIYLASLFTVLMLIEYFIFYMIFSIKYIRILIPIIILLSIIANFYMYTCNTHIGYDVILSIFQTNLREALEIINGKIIVLTILVFLFFATLRTFGIKINFKSSMQSFKIRIITILSCVLFAIVITIANYKQASLFVRNDSRFAFSININNYIFNTYRVIRDIVSKPKKLKIIDENPIIQDSKTRNFVIFLVGETSRAQNYSLNGYDRKTNPLLEKQNVINFSNTTSCATCTAKSVPCMFSSKKRTAWNTKDFEENAIDILQKVGIRTIWYENDDGCKGVCNRMDVVDVQHRKHPLCYDSECKDEILLEDLNNEINLFKNSKTKNTLIVMHMIGSHGPLYHLRYTKKFAKFQPECHNKSPNECSRNELLNAYDNTILYQDFVISAMIDKLKNLKKQYADINITLMYVSDHGESLGENGMYLHSFPYSMAPKEQKHVPLIFWTTNPIIRKNLIKNSSKSASHDNIFHTLLGLFNVKSIVKDDSLDLTL